MFTGIIEDLGTFQAPNHEAAGTSLTVAARKIADELKAGDSVAVNGVCLTATRTENGVFTCDLSPETLQRTCLGRLREGVALNLERPLAVGDRLGGHFVMGHVDGIGRLASTAPNGSGCVMSFCFPPELARYLVYKGSIAVDGISLTIASLANESFTVAVIPHTLEVTNLKALRPGDEVNLEVDILGKYFERFLQLGLLQDRPGKLTFEYLKEQGF